MHVYQFLEKITGDARGVYNNGVIDNSIVFRGHLYIQDINDPKLVPEEIDLIYKAH
ncbi:hypothetical protein MYVALT_G_01850 [Candidatus Vallotia tarda]|uniref:Uncharacterized protein n=1 Tax=Candidatus Vallotiella hemipterorum TaxID=1177213 RepID=A0A916JRJ6_9BURK|nr:hypothetical protein MYVALT_G_01850 [Candidatus Vallotia tarda]